MNNNIPINVVRKIISDILIKRSNVIMKACEEIMEKEISYFMMREGKGRFYV